MADPADQLPPADDSEKWLKVGEQFLAGGMGAIAKGGLDKMVTAKAIDMVGAVVGFAYEMLADFGVGMAKGMAGAEDKVAPAFADMAAAAASDIFGVNVPRSAFTSARGGAARTAGGAALGRGFMDLMRGQGTTLTPSDEPAARYVTAVAGMALEDWFKGWLFEVLSSLVPQVDIGKIETYGALGDKMSNMLGMTGVSRRVFRPIVDATIITPLEWSTNKAYRPRLLTHGDVARQLARGKWTRSQAIEELARQGFSDDRIDAMLNSVAKFRTPADAFRLSRAGVWSAGQAVQHLKDQGYDTDGATDELTLERLRAVESFDRAMAGAGVDGYVAGRLAEGELGGFLNGVTISPQEKAQLFELAAARRIAGRRPLSASEAEACAKAKIISIGDYRRALVREGRTDDAVAALELLLRFEIDKAKAIADHRRDMEAERAREKAAREAARAKREAERDAARALRRRGSEADLEDAAIRGLIPIGRVEDVYRPRYDPDTVAILIADVEDRKLAYDARRAAAAAAAARAAVRGIDVGALRSAVLAGVLTLDEFRGRLGALRFSDADAALLAETLAAELDARAAAKALHDEAVAAARVRHVDLATLETLVRRGHRSLAQYDATLHAFGFDDAARAALVERLQLLIDDDAAARQARADADAKLRARGLSLEQFRRAVVLHLKTLDDFGAFLLAQGFTTDAQQVLVAALRVDVDEADAARQRRSDAEARADARDAPLSDVARAARLGLIPVQAYADRLAHDGYTPDAIELELDLLVEEMAQLQTQRDARDAAEAAARARGLSLDQVARAVKAHTLPLAVYTSTATSAGFAPDAADALTALLAAEVAALDAAAARRAAVEARAGVTPLSIAQLEAATVAGLLPLDAYAARVQALGVDAADAQLLAGVLQLKIEARRGALARQAALDAAQATTAIARADVAGAVIDGRRSIDAYRAFLTDRQYAPADVDLLVELLAFELDTKPPPAGP
jgi:hypothetical protein